MKKVILSIAAVVLVVFVCKAQAPAAQTGAPTQTATVTPSPTAPIIQFEKELIDYGTVEFDADGNREFKFKNVGKDPLIIYGATGSCGCTVPTWPKDPIKSGETGVIKVHYDTKRSGSFEKTVTVNSNSKTPASDPKTLRIKGVVGAAATPASSVTTTVTPPAPH